MSQPNDSGDKNEKPTPKKIRDARKEGNVAKSKDLSQTVTTFVWVLVLLGLAGYFADRVALLLERSWTSAAAPSTVAMAELSTLALQTLLWLVVVPLALVAFVGVLVEFLQVGPLLAFKKIAPKASHVHPVEGFKRVFAKDNLVETGKALLKTLLLSALLALLALDYLDDALALIAHPVTRVGELTHHLTVKLGLWVAAAFGFISLADWLYQRHRHEKRLRMSLYDIRQEFKQTEGDPHIKGQRKQLHREWSSRDGARATREASALVVNPTHIAVAIRFEPDDCPLPLITAKAQGADAQRLREAARDANVPIVRNIPLARELNFRADYDDVIPEDLFEPVAEVLAWAQRVTRDFERDPSVSLYRDTQ